jgi:hypothetical protein
MIDFDLVLETKNSYHPHSPYYNGTNEELDTCQCDYCGKEVEELYLDQEEGNSYVCADCYDESMKENANFV